MSVIAKSCKIYKEGQSHKSTGRNGKPGIGRQHKTRKPSVPGEESPAAKPPRNIRVASLEELPASFTAAKRVMDMQYCVENLSAAKRVMGMQYCVENLSEFRTLAGKNNFSKFSVFWAPDHQNTTPMKPAFTPEKLVTGKEPLLTRFYDAGLTSAGGVVNPLTTLFSHLTGTHGQGDSHFAV
jgi:hypothetical protein